MPRNYDAFRSFLASEKEERSTTLQKQGLTVRQRETAQGESLAIDDITNELEDRPANLPDYIRDTLATLHGTLTSAEESGTKVRAYMLYFVNAASALTGESYQAIYKKYA